MGKEKKMNRAVEQLRAIYSICVIRVTEGQERR